MSPPSRAKFLARIRSENLGSPRHEPQSAAEAQDDTIGAPAAIEQSRAALSTDKSVLGAKLESTTSKSLDKANEILDLPLDPDRQHYPAELRARAALINTALGTQARVDETGMKRERIDRLPEILALIREEEKKLPSILGSIAEEEKK
jgi:hypothetical protein